MLYIIQAESLVDGATSQLHQAIAGLHEMAFSHKAGARGAQILQAMRQDSALVEYLRRHVETLMRIFRSETESSSSNGDLYTKISIIPPYPTQVLPLVAFEKELEIAGFELINRGDS
jgi:hypothetical protein